MRRISYKDALREAMHQEMERDPSVFVFGVGVPNHAKIFGTTEGLAETFGPNRCFDTPISEEAMTGFALGASIRGLKPIHVHIRVDFLLLAMNQLVNNISSFTYSTGGQMKAPLVIRAIIGRGWGQGYQHSKALFSYFTHIPGLKVIAPTSPRDAKGMLTAAIRDENPVICMEHRWLYWGEEDVPEESYEIPLGKGRVLRSGKDLTIIGISWMNAEALVAADWLAKHGVDVEVIDPRTLAPLDDELIAESVRRTGLCIVADCDWVESGFTAELSARITEMCFADLKAPVRRLGSAHTPCPTVRELENEFYADAGDIVAAAQEMLGLEENPLPPELLFSHEHRFKGPF
ncbi:MAG: Pdhb [Bryobacterales bacterium]|nr:Pdhb [Bryobacterales bacterium]